MNFNQNYREPVKLFYAAFWWSEMLGKNDGKCYPNGKEPTVSSQLAQRPTGPVFVVRVGLVERWTGVPVGVFAQPKYEEALKQTYDWRANPTYFIIAKPSTPS